MTILLSPTSTDMWYDERRETAGWQRRIRETPRNIPSLYFMACRAYLPVAGSQVPMARENTDPREDRMGYLIEANSSGDEWGLMPIQPGLEVPSLILENRRPPDDQLYLSDPVRFNPCQWRIVYTTPGGVTNGKIALLNIGGWFTTETMEVGAERVNQVLQELRAAIPDSVLHEESMWLNDADMNLQLPSYWIATHSDEPNQEIIGRMKAEEDRKKRAKRE